MKTKSSSHSIQIVLTLVVFCLFMVCVLIVLTSGVKAYSSISDKMSTRYESRICTSYISSKIRYNEENNNVYLGKFHGRSALVINENISGVTYNTIIYFYNGTVKELYCEKGSKQSLGSGNDIAELKSIKFSYEEKNMIKVTCIDNNKNSQCMYFSLKTGGSR